MDMAPILEGSVDFVNQIAAMSGVDGVWGMYQWLDRAPLGRNEAGLSGPWWRHHDKYGEG